MSQQPFITPSVVYVGQAYCEASHAAASSQAAPPVSSAAASR